MRLTYPPQDPDLAVLKPADLGVALTATEAPAVSAPPARKAVRAY